MSKRPITSAAAAAVALAVAATASSANDLFWQGTDGSVDSPNYFDATTSTPGVGVGGTDSLYIGAGSTLTQVSNLTAGRLIVGHGATSTGGVTGAPEFAGAGTVNITGGTFTTTSTVPVSPPAGTSSPDASLIIGYSANGSFSISNAAVTASDTVVVGFSATDPAVSGSLAINAGGSLTVSKGGLQLGGNGSTAQAGAGGSVTVNGGTLSIVDPPGTSPAVSDLVIGVWNRSTFAQTGGFTTVADETFVGRRNADFSAFNLSGGTFSTRVFNQADTNASGRIDDTTSNITNATLNVAAGFNVSNGGNARRATVNIGQGANVSIGGTLAVAGGGNQASDTALDTNVNIASTANVSITGGINLGGNSNRTALKISDSATVRSGTVNVGNGATSNNTSLTISGGTVTTGGFNVGTGAGANNSSATISGGIVGTGAITVGNGVGATNSSLTITGDAKVTGSSNIVVGNASSTSNSTATINGNAVVNFANGITLGLAADPNVVFNVGGNANITLANSNSTTVHLFVGRGTSTATFNMTGGTLTSPNLVLVGSPATGGNATATVNHSAGTINAGTSTVAGNNNRGFKVADTVSTATYNLSGTGTINVAGGVMIVGRNGVGTMNQTGGSVTANGSLSIGDAETSTTFGTGTYNISGGTIAATVPVGSTANALTVGKSATGTFRVIGQDATINVTGNVLVNTVAAVDTTPARVGTLAYQLEAGESLSKINATGTATFSAGSVLALDLNGVATPASSYDLITATDVINNGLVLSVPTGWHVDLVDGATTKTLQFVQAINGDANRNGKIDADDYALIDRGAARQFKWWHNGDFNDNGVIDLQDYLLIDTALSQQNGGHLSPEFLAARESRFGSGYVADLVAAVPEPGTLSVLAAGVLPLLGRRRRSR